MTTELPYICVRNGMPRRSAGWDLCRICEQTRFWQLSAISESYFPSSCSPRRGSPPSSSTTMSAQGGPSSRPQSASLSTADTLEAPPTQVETKDGSETSTKDFGFVPIPKRLQYDPDHPAHFGILMNVIFGLASTFSTSSLSCALHICAQYPPFA